MSLQIATPTARPDATAPSAGPAGRQSRGSSDRLSQVDDFAAVLGSQVERGDRRTPDREPGRTDQRDAQGRRSDDVAAQRGADQRRLEQRRTQDARADRAADVRTDRDRTADVRADRDRTADVRAERMRADRADRADRARADRDRADRTERPDEADRRDATDRAGHRPEERAAGTRDADPTPASDGAGVRTPAGAADATPGAVAPDAVAADGASQTAPTAALLPTSGAPGAVATDLAAVAFAAAASASALTGATSGPGSPAATAAGTQAASLTAGAAGQPAGAPGGAAGLDSSTPAADAATATTDAATTGALPADVTTDPTGTPAAPSAALAARTAAGTIPVDVAVAGHGTTDAGTPAAGLTATAPEAAARAGQPGVPAFAPAGPAPTANAPTAAAPSAPMPSTLPERAVATQLTAPIASLRAAGDGEHVMVVRVSPDSIGPVRVRAHIGAEGVRIELLGATDAAREALKAALPDLRRDLIGAGLPADISLGTGRQSTGPDTGWGGSGLAGDSRGNGGRPTPGSSGAPSVVVGDPASGPSRPAPAGLRGLDITV